MISLEEALQIHANLPPLHLDIEEKNIFEAKGYVLAQDFFIKRPLPLFDNSAMDGYVFHTQYINHLKITQSILAGSDASHITLQPNEAMRIMTGAMIPNNANAVLPFEDALLQGDKLIAQKPLQQHANIRKKGEEKQIGDLIAPSGTPLDFATIGLLASQGYAKIPVFEKLKIALFSSGDEIKEIGENALPHQIYNINAPSLFVLLGDFDCNYLGILQDNLSLEEAILKASKQYHIILTSGGASVGDVDLFEKILLNNNAEIFYHKINLKPGKPLMVAKLNHCYFFSLPGNPLSAISNLLALILPTLHRLSKSIFHHPLAMQMPCKEALVFKNNRAHIILGTANQNGFTPYKNGKYSPNAISTFQACNSFAMFSSNVKQIAKNEKILILPYTYSLTQEAEKFVNGS